jgi:trimeric autotransporter adhesin
MMTKDGKILVAAAFLLAGVASAIGGATTIGVTVGSGQLYDVVTDGSGHYVGISAIADGTAAANLAAVKAASTAAGATDPALVVAISPNNTVAATQSGTWNVTNVSGTVSLPTGAATSANQTNASQKTQIVDGSGNVIASTSNNLNVQCANCSGSGASAADAATFTAGTSTFAPAGGEYTSGGATACVTAHQCLVGITSARAFLTDLSSQAGTAITSAPSAYGTAPTGNVIGVNAFVTNATALGSAVSALSSPVVLATDQAAVAVKAASGAIASGAVASGAFASGSIASGAFASGAFASGSFLNATAGDPCMFQAKTNVPISTAAGTLALVAGVSAKKIYVCSLSLISSGAIAVSLSEGSGTTCGTSAQAGVIGVATNGTAANGLSLAANGGLTLGNGGGTVAATATAANYLCLFQSGTTQMAGNLTYVQQ